MKKILFLLFLLIFSFPIYAEKDLKDGSIINWGAKAGFTSSLLLINDFYIGDVKIEKIQNTYQIGYFGSLFMRINFEQHFLQPEVSYNLNRSTISFTKPSVGNSINNTTSTLSSISSSIHSVDIPIIYGYNFIKQGPYSLAVFGGPKLRYIWKKKSEVSFNNFDQVNLHEQLRPFNLSLTCGVAVTISRVFFDFRYDLGLTNSSKCVIYNVNQTADSNSTSSNVRFKRRDNVLSFSLGFFF